MRRGIRTEPFAATIDDGGEDEPDVPFTVRPLPQMSFTWSPPRNESGRYFLNGTFNFSNGIYVAVGFRSAKKMYGPIVLCAVNNSDGRASCNDFVGDEYQIKPANLIPAAEANISAAWKVGDTVFIRFEKLVYDPEQNISDMELNGDFRWIFSRGKWYADRPAPSQHETDQKSSFFINYITGETTKISSTKYVIVLIVACISVGIASLWLSLMRAVHAALSDRVRFMVGAGLLGAYCILVLAYILVNYYDYRMMITSKAFYRAVGDGAVLCFASMMFPVARRVFLGFFGIPPERAIKYHVFGTAVLLLTVSVHAIGMWSQFGSAYLTRWRDKDRVSVLPGLIAFVLLLVISAISLARNHVSYRLHRALHYLYLPCVFFAACHATALTYALAPAAIFLFLSFVHMKIAVPVGEICDGLERAVYIADAHCVVLDFSRNDYLRPGSWYFLGIPSLGREQHPFFVTRSRQTSNACHLRLVIKDTRKVQMNRGSHAPARGWTGALAELLAAKKPIESYVLDGPHGITEVDPFNYGNYVFIGGGIGIAPLVHLLQMVSLSSGDGHDEDIIGPVKLKANILFLWVIPNESLLAIFAEDLLTYQSAVQNASKHLKLRIAVFVTGSQPLSSAESAGKIEAMNIPIQKLRPNLVVELKTFEEQQSDHYVKAVPSGDKAEGQSYSSRGKGAMYLCGPKSLTNEARAAAKSLTALSLDINEFEFGF